MKRKAILAAAASLAAVALLTTGCSSSPGISGGGSTAGASSGPIKFTIGTASVSNSAMDLLVGIDEGIFKKHGLIPTLVPINSSSQLAAALQSGSADIAQGSGVAVASADISGQDIVMLGSDQSHDNSSVWAPLSIKSPKDLKGKKYAVTGIGSNSDYESTVMMESVGLKGTDLSKQALGSEPSEVAALKAGQVSAAGLSDTAAQSLVNDPKFHKIYDVGSVLFPYHVYATSRKFLDANPEVVKRFVAAENEALSYIRDPKNFKTIDAVIMKYTKTTDEAQTEQDRATNLKVKNPQLVLPEAFVKKSFELAVGAGAGPMPADINKYTDTKYLK